MIPDTKTLVQQFAQDIREAAVLAAFALQAIEGRREDEVSENDAYKRYGKAWVKSHVAIGQLHFTRVGPGETSTKVYSVFEIVTLKMAEKRLTQVYNNALIEQENRKRNGNERDL